MNEIEGKILEINVSDIEKKLLALGAMKIFDGKLVATIFDFPDKRFSQREIIVRLRKEGDKTKLTYKKLLNTDKAKVSEEIEVEVNEYEAMEKILLAIGLEPKRGYPLTKHRISYSLDNVHFDFDTFPQFPKYLEIEASDNKIIEDFNNQFEEDPYIVELFKMSNRQLENKSSMWNYKYKKHDIYNENDIPDDYIQNILYDLDEIEELVPMPEGFEWREAIMECYNKYKSKKIECYIDNVYEEYQMLKDMCISGNRTKEQLLKDLANDKNIKRHRKEILKGRKALREPLDFNF